MFYGKNRKYFFFAQQKYMDNQNKFLLLSNLAIQMGVIITTGVFLGDYVDSKLNNQTPWWTLLFSLLSISAALYHVLKTMKKNV